MLLLDVAKNGHVCGIITVELLMGELTGGLVIGCEITARQQFQVIAGQSLE